MTETALKILHEGWGLMLLRGAAMTMLISCFGMALGLLIGIAGATVKVSGARFASLLVSGYTTIVRSIPELLIIYLLFSDRSSPSPSLLTVWAGKRR